MKNVIYVPLWLREYLGSRGLGYESLLKESLSDILSESDVKSYQNVETILQQVGEVVNPIHSVAQFFLDYFRGLKPCGNLEAWLVEIAGATALENKSAKDLYLFYYGMIEGPSINGLARQEDQTSIYIKARKVDFDFEVVGDTMVVIAKYNDAINNTSYGYRAELLSKCIEKMHLFMSFEEIAGTEIFSAFTKYVEMENQFIRDDAALPNRS